MNSPAYPSMDLIESFEQARIICIGDVMLDRFVYGEVSRISPEAPIPVMRRERESQMLGGAGNVARNIVSLGASCLLMGVLGDDATAEKIKKLCDETPLLSAQFICEPQRRSSEKARFVSGGQQLLRCDDEQVGDISAASEVALLDALKASLKKCDLLVVSDYAKGVLSDAVLSGTIAAAKAAGVPVFVDPKRSDISAYGGADLLSPNLKEMRAFGADAPELMQQYAIGAIALTRGKDGMALYQQGEQARYFTAQARQVYDVSGAGDTVMATLAVACGAGAELSVACELANVAAGIAVSRPGTATVYRTDLKAALHHQQMAASASKLASAEMARAIVENWKEEGLRVGFTNGCFDLLHVGHLQSLTEAKSHCDKLVVAINADASVRRLKGESRPLNSEMDRADLLGGMAPVDLVVIFRENTPEALLERLRPDVLMKGADYTLEQVVGGEFVKSYGGQVKLLAIKEGHSTTGLIEKGKQASEL